MEEISVEQLASAPQPMTYSAYDSAEGIAPDSDLDDEQIRRMLASPLKIREGEENEGVSQAYHSERESLMTQSSWNPGTSGKPDAMCVQKREANAKRHQAYHSGRESLMKGFVSRDRSFHLNLVRCFHATVSTVLLIWQMLGNHFLMETRIMCLIKQGLNL